jgi:Flp pilus assembly pilin Flp
MRTLAKRFVADQSGSPTVEYAVVAGIIALALIAALGSLRDNLSLLINNTADNVK